MGFKLTWLSFESADRQALLRKLDLASTGVFVNDVVDGVAGRPLADDAYLVVAMNDQSRYMDPALLHKISRTSNVLVCHVHEGCMFSHAAAWVGGDELWHVTHDSDEGIMHLHVAGKPPTELAGIRAAADAAQQAETELRRNTPPRTASSDLPPDLMAFLKTFGSVTASPPPLSIGVDHMFDVAVALCEALVGLRHDHASFWHPARFEVLAPVA